MGLVVTKGRGDNHPVIVPGPLYSGARILQNSERKINPPRRQRDSAQTWKGKMEKPNLSFRSGCFSFGHYLCSSFEAPSDFVHGRPCGFLTFCSEFIRTAQNCQELFYRRGIMRRGEKVADLRNKKGLNQAALAKAIKKSPGWVASLETDRLGRLKSGIVDSLSKVLGAPPDYFQDDPIVSDNVISTLYEISKGVVKPGEEVTIPLNDDLKNAVADVSKEHFSSLEGAALYLIKEGAKVWRSRRAQDPARPQDSGKPGKASTVKSVTHGKAGSPPHTAEFPKTPPKKANEGI